MDSLLLKKLMFFRIEFLLMFFEFLFWIKYIIIKQSLLTLSENHNLYLPLYIPLNKTFPQNKQIN